MVARDQTGRVPHGVFVAGRGKARGARITSRNGTEYTAEFPEVVAAAMELPARTALLDGEVVVLDERGRSSFRLLQQLGASRRGLAFFASDLLALDGEDLKPLPLQERKRRLENLLGDGAGVVRYTPHFDTAGATVLAHACRLGAEGIVSKCRTAPYRAGRRSADWQKTKCVRRQEFVVGGFTDPEGSPEGVGSLLLGYYAGNSLRYTGSVGTGRGWNDAFGRRLRELLEPLEVGVTPFDPAPPRPARSRSARTGSSRGSWPKCSSPSGPATEKSGTHRGQSSDYAIRLFWVLTTPIREFGPVRTISICPVVLATNHATTSPAT